MRQKLGVALHVRYLPAWWRARRFSPQKPEVHAREREPAKVAARRADDWGRLKKRPPAAPTSSRSTSRDSS